MILKPYPYGEEKFKECDYSVWRNNNLDLTEQIHKNEKLMIIFEIFVTASTRKKAIHEPLSQTEKVFVALVLHLAEKIKDMQEELYRKTQNQIETLPKT